jgi:alcohol dehydrogenase class IV
MAREFAANAAGVECGIDDAIHSEPTLAMFEAALARARAFGPDTVAGLGGGSALDVSKLVAALLDGRQAVHEVIGIGLLRGRAARLICLPTTSGTGSEVSPNSILLDEAEGLKKGVISPFLVPDAAVIDPLLTVTMPPAVTAATGIDALAHCIEAFANRFAHPLVDTYAIEGIRRVGRFLERAVRDGGDLEAREEMAVASMYGGLCLGPVNTAAAHALAYPLGSEFHVGHGVSIAVLLPHVLEFNLGAAPERYAAIGEAFCGRAEGNALVQRTRELSAACGIPSSLSKLGITEKDIERMAEGALKITRLLKNNLREVTLEDAKSVYFAALR